ncbi:MAG: single-stranded DNA-binding protein [Saprospiraceae bacterium]|nr:single-stranded DNA-binding protein [Saprospiraceae bacterium]
MLNKVMLIGNLGRDPEVRHLDNGAAVAKFSIATNERYKDKAGEYQTITEWHDIIMWRGLAELAERLLTKGKLVYVEGKLTTRKWQDQNGQDRRTTEVVANNFQILEKREGSGGSGTPFPSASNEPAANKSLPNTSQTPIPSAPETSTTSTTSNTEMPEDDLPF